MGVTAAIVQARMTSSRFPGKVLAPLFGVPVLKHVLARVKMIRGLDAVVCAFPDDPRSEPIQDICREMGVTPFAGDEFDVLMRYYEAAQHIDGDLIMRITGDCPLINPAVCGRMLDFAKREKFEYVSNVFPERTYPKGLDCEVFTFACLEKAYIVSSKEDEREHVTLWMQRNYTVRKCNVVRMDDMSSINYCIDYPEDISRIETEIRKAPPRES